MTKNIVKFEGAFTADTRKIINDNFEDFSSVSTQIDVTSSVALVNATGLVTESLPVGTYYIYANLITTANAAGGIKVALKQGTASMLSSVNLVGRALTASAVAVANITSTTDATTIIGSTAAVINTIIEGIFTVSTAGTIQVQFAQNVSNAAATSILVGSHLSVAKIG